MSATGMERITLPYRYHLRSYSGRVMEAWRAGVRRLLLMWHRRAVKTTTLAQLVIEAAVTTVGVYWIVTPAFIGGRRIWWDGLSHDGRRMLLGYIPPALIASISENEMQVVLVNGSVIQIVGADQPDRLARGPGLRGVVFDEYAVMASSLAWDTLRPILMENNGWAAFGYTPLGRNHAAALYDMAVDNSEWFVSRLTVEDTRRDAEGEDGSRVITAAAIESERAAGMPDDMIQQEFFLSFNASLPGVYFAKELRRAEAEGRIDHVTWTPRAPVHTVMDLGISDATVILFFQLVGAGVHVIDMEVGRGEAVAYYTAQLQARQRERTWTYGQHWAPHDVVQRHDAGSAVVSRLEQYRAAGFRLSVLPRAPVQEGIAAARAVFPKVRFDKTRCRDLLHALATYRSEWSEERQVLALRPVHNAASDYADSFRYLALAVDRAERRETEDDRPRQTRATSALTSWDTRRTR